MSIHELKDILKKLGWTQAQLAAKCGVNERTVRRWLAMGGRERAPMLAQLVVRGAK